VQSNYYAEVDTEECAGCETCLGRCQMEAITIVSDTHKINLDRCIVCGLCVTTCSTGALSLVRKADEQWHVVYTRRQTFSLHWDMEHIAVSARIPPPIGGAIPRIKDPFFFFRRTGGLGASL